MQRSARLRRYGAASLLGAGLVLLAAVPAQAHVTVSSPDAEPGGYGKLVFRVPSESDTADTTKVTVELPEQTPFTSVSTKPLPGWTVETKTEKLDQPVESDGFTLTEAVTSVTWTAEPGSALRPHEFAEFELSVGTFPETGEQLVFPATQTYSDGEVVKWNQPPTDGAEPESPAPVLELAGTAEAPETPAGKTEAASDAGTEAQGSTGGASSESGSDTTARLMGGAGLAVGLIALGWVGLGRPRQRG